MFALVQTPPKLGFSVAVLLNNPPGSACLGRPRSPEDAAHESYFHISSWMSGLLPPQTALGLPGGLAIGRMSSLRCSRPAAGLHLG